MKKFLELEDEKIWKVIWITPFMFCGMGVIFTVDLSSAHKWFYIIMRYMAGMGAFTVFYILVRVLKQVSDNAVLRKELHFIDEELLMQKKQYAALVTTIEEMRKARHDFRHHLLLVRSYIEKDNKMELLEYLEEQQKKLPTDMKERICENAVINVLACYYIELAKEKGFYTDFKVNIDRNMGILDSDLSIIFGNCLENALEACERMQSSDALIRVRAGIRMGQLIIVIGNSFDGHTILHNGEFRSIKRDGDKGIGIQSIRSVAEKYGGEPNFEVINQNFFKVSMVLMPKLQQ